MTQDIDLLHFGMGKCMSTSLQQLWRESKQVRYVDTRELSWKVNAKLIECVQKEKAIPPIDLPLGQIRNELPLIISNEEFTFSFTTAPQLAAFLPLKQKYIANQLQHRAKRLLLIVRSPMSWIKSAHSERIHKGGFETMTEYLDNLGPLVTAMTNVRQFLSYWEDSWDRLTIMPMELFVKSPDQFWKIYVDELGLPKPTDTSAMNVKNKTNKDSVETAAALNKLLFYNSKLAEKYSPEPNYNNLVSNKQIVGAMDSARMNGTYLALNRASQEEIQAIQEYINFVPNPDFGRVSLSTQMREHLEKNFIETLRPWRHMAEWLDNYADELKPAA